jgi:hypothetical protein
MLLQTLIIQRDACALDETSKQNLARHLQKFVKAVQTYSAEVILKDDQIQLLTSINNEAKVRRSTRSLVLGKAKVMSYEDLEEARAKRVERDAAQAAKGKGRGGRKPEAEEATADKAKRGRKRKIAVLEAEADAETDAEALEPNAEVARMINAPAPASARASVVQMSGTQVAEDEIVPEPWRAPVARMF